MSGCHPLRAVARSLFLLLPLLAAATTARADAVDDYVEAQLRWQHIPGLSLAVVKDGKIVKAKGYGLANVETKTPATPETVYRIGSVSKQFLAAGILLLVQEGKLSLDEKIVPYLDGTPEAWKDITLRHLLTHTSGIVRDPPGFDPFKVQSDADVIKTAYPVPLTSPPGERWAYSNTGYYILAEIIRKVTGEPWSAFIAERVFTPVGMTATKPTTTKNVSHRAAGYALARGRLGKAENWLALRPSGAFLSTVLDFARWDAALSSNALLTESSRAQMWTPVRLNDGTTRPYGFAWFVDAFQGHKRLRHGGGVPGFQADFERFVDDKLTVIVLVNSSSVDLEKIAPSVAGFYVPGLTPPVAPPIPDTEPTITAEIKSLVADMVAGKWDTSQFTPETASQMTDDLKSRVTDDLRGPGRIQSIALVERKNEGDKRIYRYRLTYRYLTLYFVCTFNKDNKITGLGLQD